jgi:hypothetical protein
MSLQSWLKQPTTISGFEKIAMGLVTSAGLFANGNHGLAIVAAAAGLAGGAVGLAMPDNTVAAADTQAAVATFVTDIQGKDQQRATADALNGVMKVLADISAKVVPTVVASGAVGTGAATDAASQAGAQHVAAAATAAAANVAPVGA